MAEATGTTGNKAPDTKAVTLDANEKGKGGFVVHFAADAADAVIDKFKTAWDKVKETGARFNTSTLDFANALDDLALAVATKGQSKDARIKDGQQQTPYKEASKHAKEKLGLAVDSRAITQARYRARKAAAEAAKKAARIAAGEEAVEPESEAVRTARLVRENIAKASKKDANVEDILGAGNALVDKLRTVMPDACIAQTADGKLLKDEYVGQIRNLSALIATVADEYEKFVPKADDVDEALAS